MKKKIIKYYGNGSITKTAQFLNVSRPRVCAWSDDMTKTQIDGVIAALVRLGHGVPMWLLK